MNKVDRREFLVSASSLAFAAGYPSITMAQQEAVPHASRAGAFWADVEDGVIVETRPREGTHRPNVFVSGGQVSKTHAPTRILHPYVRESYLRATGGDTAPALRGKDRFVKVDWDRAIALTDGAIRDVIRDNGNQAIFSPSYGGSAHGGVLTPNVLQAEFFHLLSGMSVHLDDYSGIAAKAIAPYIVGDQAALTSHTAWPMIHDNTECFVLVGVDPRKNARFADGTATHRDDDQWQALGDGNVEVISINPQRTSSDDWLGAEWVPILPGTDAALFLAMTQHIVDLGLHDTNFLESHTTGWLALVADLNGENDGIVKDPAWAEEITGVPADQIRSLTIKCLEKHTQLAVSRSTLRTEHGEMAFWAPLAFTCFTGQFGTAGGGVGYSWHWTISETKKTPRFENLVGACPTAMIAEMLLNPGTTFQFQGRNHTYTDIKLIYTSGTNFVNRQQNTNRLLDGLQHVDTHIVQDCWWTATARYADIVLPAVSTLERDDISFEDNAMPGNIYAMRQAIDPLGDSLDDYEIFSRLAAALGIEDAFTRGQSQIDRLREIYVAAGADKSLSWDAFRQAGFVELPLDETDDAYVLYGDFHRDPVANPLNTPSGKVELVSAYLAELNLPDCPAMPSWLAPSENSPGELGQGHVSLTIPHPENRLISSYAQTDLRYLQNVDDREFIRINPRDAADLGIEKDDLVEIENDRGTVIAGAVLDDGIKPGVVSVNLGAWLSLDSQGRCNSGAVNVVTSDRQSSAFSLGVAQTFCTVTISRAKDVESQNRAYEPPETL